jgi:hypothetical protein
MRSAHPLPPSPGFTWRNVSCIVGPPHSPRLGHRSPRTSSRGTAHHCLERHGSLRCCSSERRIRRPGPGRIAHVGMDRRPTYPHASSCGRCSPPGAFRESSTRSCSRTTCGPASGWASTWVQCFPRLRASGARSWSSLAKLTGSCRLRTRDGSWLPFLAGERRSSASRTPPTTAPSRPRRIFAGTPCCVSWTRT